MLVSFSSQGNQSSGHSLRGMESKRDENVNEGKQSKKIIDLSPATEEVFVQRKWKEQVEEKAELKILQEKLR